MGSKRSEWKNLIKYLGVKAIVIKLEDSPTAYKYTKT